MVKKIINIKEEYIKMIKYLKIYYLLGDYVNIDNKKHLLYF